MPGDNVLMYGTAPSGAPKPLQTDANGNLSLGSGGPGGNVTVTNVNPNGQAAAASSSPVVLASDKAIQIPAGATQVVATGTATNGAATATIAGVAGKFTWLMAIIVTVVTTATAGSGELSIAGVTGSNAFEFNAPGTAGVNQPLVIVFPFALQSTAVNTNIVVNLPALGAGTGKAAVVAIGYYL